ncbi:MAG: Metal dependent phosphohydrolase [Frankiales bacterium]|nr:Metal dependent phosphohydrolase [Frankiales bacterium]
MSAARRPAPLPIAFLQLLASHPLILPATALVCVAAPYSMLHGQSRAALLATFAFVGLIFIGELARVALPGDREASPLATAGGLAFALTETIGVGPTSVAHGAMVTITGTAFASLAGAMVHAAVGRSPRLDTVSRRILVVGLAAALLPLISDVLSLPDAKLTTVAVLVAVVSCAAAADVVLAAFDRRWRLRTPFFAAIEAEVRLSAGLGAAIGATGVLIPLAAHWMGLWALPALSLPLLVTQFAYRRYARIRATYGQTIRALSRITEVGGYVVEGHAERVTTLAIETGRALGMTEDDLVDLEYAALLHDVGQLSLDDPIPRGSTLIVTPQHRARVAGLGADIIRSTGFLDRVAVLVERQAEPYRRNRRDSDESVPLGSRIIKAVSAYDDLVSESGQDRRGRTDALERLRLGMAYEYDPRVVAALAEVIARTAA